MLINYDKKEVFKLLKKEFLNKKYSLKDICLELNIHLGTIKRWIELEEVPPQYFIDLNKLTNFKYRLNVNKEEHFKIYDQFFTNHETAKLLISKTLDFIANNYDLNLDDYTFIDPCAGDGSFYKNFPKQYKKIGLDIDPKIKEIKKQDFLDFKPKTNKNIIISNPPFGLRGQKALKFINHSAKFCDFVCFILPPLFNSNGKGSPMLRVDKQLSLVAEFDVKNDFYYPDSKPVEVNSIFQIWTKLKSDKVIPFKIENKRSEWIKVYALSNGKKPSQKRNVKMIENCDFYLPSTCFEGMQIYDSFYKLPNKRGYGVVILKDKNKILKVAKEIDWEKVSFKSTNGAVNLRTQLIINAIEEKVK
ncbi:restriction endonuclease subunit M [[Mycoplasma] falconis]|uniref:Restriction endonuclease subunit M n=1 Tax=[Mycoplasma] falconis TaxID=92403 RepID=A0A501X9P1_9BACT|nr:restriction endonuclease subunit M [[Mycoplasma] falconis]TPE57196.1 restriction endonuclease subunit M [[Mycoplasma] falconis]